jgi:hypothetical protein
MDAFMPSDNVGFGIFSPLTRILTDSSNQNTKVTTDDMMFMLWLNIFFFFVFMAIFEFVRGIKQVYLKRAQKRFQVQITYHFNSI